MEDEEDEPDACLQSQLLAVKHCLEAAKRKEHRHEASELDQGLAQKENIWNREAHYRNRVYSMYRF